jgi:hypothetical protein
MWQLMPWNEYKRLALEEARRQGFLATAERLGLGKTTLYKWAMEERLTGCAPETHASQESARMLRGIPSETGMAHEQRRDSQPVASVDAPRSAPPSAASPRQSGTRG